MPVDRSVEFKGFALKDPKGHFEPWSYHPRLLEDEDVEVRITHCGICASDIHTAFGGWGRPDYPIIVGHEIVGTVSAIGKHVTHLKVGDRVGCGAQCSACYNRHSDCDLCMDSHEQYCPRGVGTYGAKFPDNEPSFGGYCEAKRFSARHAFLIPDNISSAEACPLLCAGATTFTPLSLHKCRKGMKVGVIGCGGLGHLAVQFAVKMGAEVVVISTSDSKRDLALKKLGAHDFVHISNEAEVKKYRRKLDLVICTANADGINWALMVDFTKSLGTFVLVGLPDEDIKFRPHAIVERGVNFCGSCIGSLNEIKQMLEFASKHDVRPMIEVLPMTTEGVNQGIKKVKENDVKFRCVLDAGK